jgi:hypothetical protein
MQTIIQREDEAFILQLMNFNSKVSTYAVLLGLAPDKLTALDADQELLIYVFENMLQYRAFAESNTAYKKLLRYGNGNQVLGPVPPVVGVAPTPTAANVQKRFAEIIQDCVRSPNFTTAIGEDLQILAPTTPFNPAEGKPVFTIAFSSGGYPVIKWKKGKYEGVEIWKKINGTFVRIDKDYKPDFTDKSDLPPLGQSAAWTYKLIYMYNEEQAGQWSDEVSVTVYGEV